MPVRLTAAPILLLALASAGCQDDRSLSGEGGSCSLDSDCSGVLLCLEGRCRDAGWLGGDVEACRSDLECKPFERCRKGVCLPAVVESIEGDAEQAGPEPEVHEAASEPDAEAVERGPEPERPAEREPEATQESECQFPTGVPCTSLCGDVNGNNEVEPCDVWLIREHAAGRYDFAICQIVVGDVNVSGTVDETDAQQILDYLNGQRPKPGC